MKKEIADEWVKAFRSGEFKQGTFYFKNYGVRCLGGIIYNQYFFHFGNLPFAVKEWAGLEIHNNDFKITLSVLKNSKKSFEEFADYIEENWRVL